MRAHDERLLRSSLAWSGKAPARLSAKNCRCSSTMRAWRSFSDALKEVTKAADIKRLKGRIKESQDIIVIGMLAMSRFVFPYISAPYYLRDVPYWSFTYLTKNFYDI